MKPVISTRILAFFLVLLIALPVWPARPTAEPELPDPGHPSMSKQQQIQLGLKTAAEVYKQITVLTDSTVSEDAGRLASEVRLLLVGACSRGDSCSRSVKRAR